MYWSESGSCAGSGICPAMSWQSAPGFPYSTLNTLLLKGTQPSLPTLRKLCAGLGITLQQFFAENAADTSLTREQKECLSLFSVLTSEEQALAIAYLKGLAHKL